MTTMPAPEQPPAFRTLLWRSVVDGLAVGANLAAWFSAPGIAGLGLLAVARAIGLRVDAPGLLPIAGAAAAASLMIALMVVATHGIPLLAPRAPFSDSDDGALVRRLVRPVGSAARWFGLYLAMTAIGAAGAAIAMGAGWLADAIAPGRGVVVSVLVVLALFAGAICGSASARRTWARRTASP
jgi:hypothetical protein